MYLKSIWVILAIRQKRVSEFPSLIGDIMLALGIHDLIARMRKLTTHTL